MVSVAIKFSHFPLQRMAVVVSKQKFQKLTTTEIKSKDPLQLHCLALNNVVKFNP